MHKERRGSGRVGCQFVSVRARFDIHKLYTCLLMGCPVFFPRPLHRTEVCFSCRMIRIKIKARHSLPASPELLIIKSTILVAAERAQRRIAVALVYYCRWKTQSAVISKQSDSEIY